jgi:hypothetical protein
MVGFKGSTQQKRSSDLFRFGYEIASNDKREPDPVGSGCHGNPASARNPNRFLLFVTGSEVFVLQKLESSSFN